MNATEVQTLAKAAHAGDRAAFEALYTGLFTPVYRYVRSQIRHHETAEDIVQTVFSKLFLKLQNPLPLPQSLRAYVYTMARNAIADFYRRPADLLPVDGTVEEIYADTAVTDSPIRASEAADDADHLIALLETLEPLEREVTGLRFFSDLPHRLIAETLGKSEANVRQIQSRALKKLRRLAPQYFI